MYAQCPDCHTIYALDTATLAQAGGTVGCAHCGASFNALRTLTEQAPQTANTKLSEHASSPAPPILMIPASPAATTGDTAAATTPPATATTPDESATAARDESAAEGTDDAPVAIASDTADVESDTADVEPDTADVEPDTADVEPDTADVDPASPTPPGPVPPFAPRSRTHRDRRHPARWVAACLVLILCLGLQVAWAEREALTANPATRPWLTRTCALVGCSVPTVRATDQLQMLSRAVRAHPSANNALLISATIRNNADFAQPYPVIAITLSDLDGQPVAKRRFRPATYITDTDTRAAGMAPGATAALTFEVRKPDRHAAAFHFDFP